MNRLLGIVHILRNQPRERVFSLLKCLRLIRIIPIRQFLILAAGSETARYKTIFQLATAYELLIIGFSKIIMKYQLKFQMIINNMYFLFLHQYL